MKRTQYNQWCDKNERLNQDHALKVGDRVYDGGQNERIYGMPSANRGVVTDVRMPESGILTISDHGTVTVLLDSGHEEHYCLINWKRYLRIEND